MPAAWQWLKARRALQKKISEGRAFAAEMAANLNYNLTHDVDVEGMRQIRPERPKTFEDAFLSRLRQAGLLDD